MVQILIELDSRMSRQPTDIFHTRHSGKYLLDDGGNPVRLEEVWKGIRIPFVGFFMVYSHYEWPEEN